MANRNFRPVRARSRELVCISGKANISTSSVVSSVDCLGATFATTGTGLFTLTLADKYAQLASANFTVVGAAATGNEVRVQTADVSGAGTITILTATSGNTAAHPGAAIVLHWTIWLRNTADRN